MGRVQDKVVLIMPLLAFTAMQAMPVPSVDSEDISQVVCILAFDKSRFITGSQFKVDAGAMLEF